MKLSGVEDVAVDCSVDDSVGEADVCFNVNEGPIEEVVEELMTCGAETLVEADVVVVVNHKVEVEAVVVVVVLVGVVVIIVV